MQLAFPELSQTTAVESLSEPASYRGLYAFHKYWGKKPAEPIRYLIQQLSSPRGLVVDPFLGSGVSALETVQSGRRFLGIDINPVAVRLAKLLISPPTPANLEKSFAEISNRAKDKINQSYLTNEGRSATHYVWRGSLLENVWVAPDEGRTRLEATPTSHDISLAERFSSYKSRHLRNPRFFKNSRINSSPNLTLGDILTGRAVHNIDVLLDAISQLEPATREAFLLSLTAAVGQMSKMVFAINSRGKSSGRQSNRMEVGSWVIGYWRPDQHFEINVWNCFQRRVQKLIKAVAETASSQISPLSGSLSCVCDGRADYSLIPENSLNVLPQIPDSTISLIITDPPHSDRIPYLELSELWNVILGESPSFEPEIVVSNAKERGKTKAAYNRAMEEFLSLAGRKICHGGFLVLFFNARTEESWQFLKGFTQSATNAGMGYCGCFPLVYSASSVVQDNRKGALRTDFGLVFSRSGNVNSRLTGIPGWTHEMPIMGT